MIYVATATAFVTVGFPFDDESMGNSQDGLAVLGQRPPVTTALPKSSRNHPPSLPLRPLLNQEGSFSCGGLDAGGWGSARNLKLIPDSEFRTRIPEPLPRIPCPMSRFRFRAGRVSPIPGPLQSSLKPGCACRPPVGAFRSPSHSPPSAPRESTVR